MWEDQRKYNDSSNHHHPANRDHHHAQTSRSQRESNGYGNAAYDPTEDLHAWSIYRQNLNADLSESAIGIGSKSGNTTEKPFGNFQLKESTVNNILSHPKYGPVRNHDPYTYLRFGLPRVKPSNLTGAQSELGGRQLSSLQPHHHGLTSDSASLSGDESPFVGRRKKNAVNGRPNGHQHSNNNNNKRIWKSNPDLAGRADIAESNFINTVTTSHANGVKSVIGVNGMMNRPTSRSSRVKSEMDLRSPAPNGFATAFGTKTTQSQLNGRAMNEGSAMNGGLRNGEHPHLIVRNLYYEVDRTSNLRKFCGAQRQKLRILDNVSFEVKSGEILAIMATNGEFYY